MRIAIDVSPLSSGHSIRGIGFYLKNLLAALKKYHPEHTYIEWTHAGEIPKDIDVIHYPYFDPFFHTLPFFPHKNTIVTIHDLTPLIMPNHFPIGIKGKIQWFLQKKSLKKVKRIITDSHASAKDIEKITGFDKNNIDIVYLAAGEQFHKIYPKGTSYNVAAQDTRYKIQIIKKYNLPDVFALYVGDGTPNKNLPSLVKAMLRTNIQLVMVGKTLTDPSVDITNIWTKDIQEVRKLREKNPEKIHLLGFVSDEDLTALYNAASAFVMPSLYEGFGLPVLEAMQCGCPVITTHAGSLKEVAGDAACIVDPNDKEAIAQAVQRIIGDKKFAKTLSEKGLLQAKKFSWEKTSDETVAAYEKVVSK